MNSFEPFERPHNFSSGPLQISFLYSHKIWALAADAGAGVRGTWGVYGACNPCPWGLKRTGGASMELISNSMEL